MKGRLTLQESLDRAYTDRYCANKEHIGFVPAYTPTGHRRSNQDCKRVLGCSNYCSKIIQYNSSKDKHLKLTPTYKPNPANAYDSFLYPGAVKCK